MARTRTHLDFLSSEVVGQVVPIAETKYFQGKRGNDFMSQV